MAHGSEGVPPLGLAVDLLHTAGALKLRARFMLNAERGALWGPSAAGKSTLLRLLAGLETPDRGRIVLGGRTLVGPGVSIPPGGRSIGYLTQAPALFPHLSVEENLRFGLNELQSNEADARASELLRLFELEELRARRPEKLSGGERQRAALARTLARRPRLVLLDEPFSALDLARKHALWAKLDGYLRQFRIAALLVSHDPTEVWRWAECVVRLEAGLVVGVGTAEEMLAEERNLLQSLLNGSRLDAGS